MQPVFGQSGASLLLADTDRLAADQLATTFCRAAFDRHRYAVSGEGLGGSNNLVDAMRPASRVDLRTIHLIP